MADEMDEFGFRKIGKREIAINHFDMFKARC
jgi:hypothetical protein